MRLAILILAFVSLAAGCDKGSMVTVEFETDQGNIIVAVDTVAAPVTAANFLRYVDNRFYEGGSFFRVVRMDNQPTDSIRIEVIQGGANPELRDQFFDSIALERTNQTGLLHVDGAISMARGGPDTADHSIFFCIGDQPSLDYGGMRNPDGQGFAAFGQVVEGMDVVRLIQQGMTENQTLMDPVRISAVRRVN